MAGHPANPAADLERAHVLGIALAADSRAVGHDTLGDALTTALEEVRLSPLLLARSDEVHGVVARALVPIPFHHVLAVAGRLAAAVAPHRRRLLLRHVR